MYPSLMPYLVAFTVFGVVAAVLALAALVRVVATLRRTPAPGVVIVPAPRAEAAGGSVPVADSHHASA